MRLPCVAVIAAAWCCVGGGCGGEASPDAAPAPDAESRPDATPPPCDDLDGLVVLLTDDPANDEDGTFFRDDSGTIHFAFISDRSGAGDVYMTSSVDAILWTEPRLVVGTPAADLLNVGTRTSDGLYHLTGRSGMLVGDATSADLETWSAPVAWTDPATMGWTAGMFQEDAAGDYWMISLSNRSGSYKLYRQRSTDRGATWDPPVPQTNHAQEDYVWGFRIAPDGTFVLVWQQNDLGDTSGFSGDVYLSTSTDGTTWTAPLMLGPDIGQPALDIWPSLIEGPGGTLWAVWVSSRGPTYPSTVGMQVYPTVDPNDVRLMPGQGYSVRSQRLANGGTILAWVATNPGHARIPPNLPHGDGSHDYLYRIVCDDWDFPPL
jgi:hypothetical protein